MAEVPVNASLIMDRSEPIGNSEGLDSRRALHTKIKNTATEPIYVGGAFTPPANADFIGRTVLGAVETFVYKVGGSAGTILKTVKVTYTSTTLEELISVEVI